MELRDLNLADLETAFGAEVAQGRIDQISEVIHPPQETNTSDGGEYLDEGIRMNEQPYFLFKIKL